MINIAIIGAGFMGDTHARCYGEIEESKVLAVFDTNSETGIALAEKYNCVYYDDFDKMTDEQNIDVIDICLPTFLHKEFVFKAARKKKNIICEKPITLKLEDFDEMVKEIKAAGVYMYVGQVLRFWPEYTKAKELYDQGELGGIRYVFAGRFSEHPDWSQWYRLPENSGGGLFDLHLHDVDFMCHMFGKVVRVYATGQKNDLGCWNFVSSTLHFENGISVSVHGVIEMEKGFPFTTQLRIVGSKKTYESNMRAGSNLQNVAGSVRETIVYDDGNAAVMRMDFKDAYELELREFVHCFDRKKRSEVISLESVRNVLCTILALRKSLETGNIVDVEY